MNTSLRFDLVCGRGGKYHAWCRTGGYGAGIGQRTHSADGREPRRTAPRTASPWRSRHASRRSPRPSRSTGHSAVGTDAWGIVRVCRRHQGMRAPVRQYDCNRRVPSRYLGRILVSASPDRHRSGGALQPRDRARCPQRHRPKQRVDRWARHIFTPVPNASRSPSTGKWSSGGHCASGKCPVEGRGAFGCR
jgi:hypothetical protein